MVSLLPLHHPGGARSFVAAVAAFLAVSVAGCRAPGNKTPAAGTTPATVPAVAGAPVNPAYRCKVTANSTSFYRLGPQQPNGPDLALKQGSRVTLIRRGFGYSQVQLEDGTSGYVGTEDIAKLTPEESAAEFKPLLPLAANGRPGGVTPPGKLAATRRRPRTGGPNIPIAPPDEPGLPAAPDPTPRVGPVPTFRY